ncbi:hypothetical protein MKX03_035173 [Papaver bracteatum]|nr:hypothetical protein MKX03_035173 [Papaver bracteatum]
MGNTLQKHKKSEGEDNFTCEICLESCLPVDKKFRNYTNNNDKQNKECASEHHFCIDCIAKHIEVKVNDQGRSIIKCPKFKCDVDLEVQSCHSILSTKVFVRWCDLLCESEILAKFGHHGKRVYFPGCSEDILNECGDDGITRTTCPSCEKLFCF